ncbi:MAG: hypothetical protein OSB70_11445 [Myxococcota bacterium]|nr:hypothetical protein [Myxococcota bacterium]
MSALEEELQTLEIKLKRLKIDYEHYFLGKQPREPINLRTEVQKQFARHSGEPIRNTALRFRYNSLNSRFQAFKRQWDSILRQIDAGTYKRHVFRANLAESARANSKAASPQAKTNPRASLFDEYRKAAQACGQDVAGLTADRLATAIARQEAELKNRLGCERVSFRVVVSNGKVKVKASAHQG